MHTLFQEWEILGFVIVHKSWITFPRSKKEKASLEVGCLIAFVLCLRTGHQLHLISHLISFMRNTVFLCTVTTR